MFDKLRMVFNDIKKGENLDIYLTVVLAIVVASLGIFGAVSFEILSAAILATLALLAISILSIRHTGQRLRESSNLLSTDIKQLRHDLQGEGLISNYLMGGYPDLTNDFRNAKRISILGRSLVSTITRYYPEFDTLLRSGHSLRCLIPEPNEETVAQMAFRSASSTNDPELIKNAIQGSIGRLKQLEKLPLNPNQLQYRIIEYIPPFGMIIFEDQSGKLKIYVKIMGFRIPGRNPTFVVVGQTGDSWFEYFYSQFENLWEVSEVTSETTES